jgi:hypothetical protein
MESRQAAIEIEKTFRSANKSILDVAAGLDVGGRVPFLCECSDTRCRELIRMPWEEFAALHRHGDLYVVVPGHELLEVEQLVAESKRYNVVEK